MEPTSSSLSLFAVMLFLLLQVTLCQRYAGLVPAFIIFGDSTVDVGNNNFFPTVARANFPPYGRDWDFGTKKPTGRFCNGRLTVDFMATELGLPYPPAFLDPQASGEKIVTGVNFASSASGFLNGTGALLRVKSLNKQLEWYSQYQLELDAIVGQANASSIVSRALFILSTGNNDFLNYYLNPLLRLHYSAAEYHRHILDSYSSFVQKLYASGARRLAVANIPPMGCLPSQITLFGRGETSHCVEFQNQDAVNFNQLMLQESKMLQSKLPELELAFMGAHSVLFDACQNPSKYGFEVSDHGCCGLGKLAASFLCNEFTFGTCKNASKFVFWDSFHPTDAMNKIIADSLLEQIWKQIFR